MNPYETLDVPRTASDEDIVKAYRRKSMKHHPDRGGDVGQFREIVEAYDVLSNPARRKKYDETGSTEQNQMPSPVKWLTTTVMAVLEETITNGKDPEKIDIILAVKKRLSHHIEKVQEAIKENSRRAKKLRAVAKRFKTKEADNLLFKVAMRPVVDMDQKVTEDKQTEQDLKEAYDMAGKYRYDFDDPGPKSSGATGTCTYSPTAWITIKPV